MTRHFFTLLLAVTLLATTASAGFINGSFDLGGTMTVTSLGASPRTIVWTQTGSGAANLADISSQSGFFVGMASPVGIATLQDPPSGVGVPFAPQTFITSAFLTPGLNNLDINFIQPRFYTAAQCSTNPALAVAGQTCTIAPNSPFSFVNVSNPQVPGGISSTATFVFQGITDDGNSKWGGIFTVQFRTPFQSVLLANSTGSITNTYSGTITVSSVPEPGTLATMGLSGLGLLALARWRRRK